MKLAQSIKRGFTLIELLVVIGILAILLAITLIAINPARQFQQANDTKRRSDINSILNAVGQYAADVENSGYAPTAITVEGGEIGSAGIDICDDLVPTYIQALPRDPRVLSGAPVVIDPITGQCPASYATGYSISRDAAGRITVEADGDITPDISVTR